MDSLHTLDRRGLLGLGAGLALAPAAFRLHAQAPSETLYHASIGAGGMAAADIGSLLGSKHLKLVAVADCDTSKTAEWKKKFPELKVYQDWREMLDKEKNLQSVNISTPDHMHAICTMACMQRGLNVYTQKPLTQTIYEARQLTKVATDKKLVTQMGIQIHSSSIHKTVVRLIQDGAIGKVKEVHSWSGKKWGDIGKLPEKKDAVPKELNWDLWLGVADDRPYIAGSYYHPGNWRKRLDFGTGTFGDMGCHILDPVFGALGVTSPKMVKSTGGAANATNWGLDSQVQYIFPGSKYTTDTVSLTWYDGDKRPPKEVVEAIGKRKLNDQGSIYLGEKGVMYSPYFGPPVLLPEEKFKEFKMPEITNDNHYLQYVEACRGNGKTSAPFSYSGPLTEMVLLGCLATRFPGEELQFDTEKLKFTNNDKANQFVKRTYRKGWQVEGL